MKRVIKDSKKKVVDKKTDDTPYLMPSFVPACSTWTDKEINTRHRTSKIYNPEKHHPLLINLFRLGYGMAEFCAEVFISKMTFHDWRNKYPDFKEIWDIGNCLAEAWWNTLPSDYNMGRWAITMKNRFGYTDQRKLNIPKIKNAENIKACLEAIMFELASDNLTGSEVNQLSNLVQTQIKVDEHTTVKDDILQLQKAVVKGK